MSVIFLLLTVSTLVAGVFLVGFIWAVRKGQYDDDRSPAVRILLDDTVRKAKRGQVNDEWSMAKGKGSAFNNSPFATDHSAATTGQPSSTTAPLPLNEQS